jgi:sec-independent protein translocase protein TatB
MFNINSWELLIIVAIALVVVGPERLPGLLLRAGQMLRQVREATEAATTEFTRELRQVAEMTEAQLTAPPAGPDRAGDAAPAPDTSAARIAPSEATADAARAGLAAKADPATTTPPTDEPPDARG